MEFFIEEKKTDRALDLYRYSQTDADRARLRNVFILAYEAWQELCNDPASTYDMREEAWSKYLSARDAWLSLR